MRILLPCLAVVGVLALLAQEAYAQHGVNVASPRAPRVQRTPGPPAARGIFNRPITKPHANVHRSETISPYLNLLRDDSEDALPSYFSLVRPQIQQQQINRQQELQLNRLSTDFQQLQQQLAIPPTGDPVLRPTGHPVQFLNTLQYFPVRK